MIDMVKVDNYMQRYIPTSNTLGVSKNKDNCSQHVCSSCMPDCHAFHVSRCTIYFNYCSYTHVCGHDHHMDNFERYQ